MADQMGAPPPSPAAWDAILRYLQQGWLVPGLLGSAVGAIRLRGRTIMERIWYVIAGSMTVLAIGPVAGPILAAWLTRFGLPSVGAAEVAIFIAGNAGAEILSAISSAAVSRIRQIGGLPPR